MDYFINISNINKFKMNEIFDIGIPPVNVEPHLLISSVREAYLKFLTQLISQNYINWCGEKPPSAVYQCAKHLELCSAARAMVVPLYRESVLNIIKNLKESTRAKEIYPELEKFCLNPEHNKIQTDHETIGMPLKQSDNNENKSATITNINVENGSNKLQVDNLWMEMKKLFHSDEDIFDSSTCDSQNVTDRIEDDCKNITQRYNKENNASEILKPVGCSVVSSSQQAKKYVYSPWPCELFYQKKMLGVKLDLICEKSIKKHAKIKNTFIHLFGYDSDDEQGLQSPDTSENFLRSCRQRAAPYLTKHLQRFLLKARIPKHLFKPLAKHLLYCLIHYNQYPNDYECYLFVKEYFKTHSHIRCQADF